MSRPEFARHVAGRMYAPSYISLETALAAYDIIPEAVTDVVSVSSKKTARFENAAGKFFYYSVKPALMFGYKPERTVDGLYYMLALPEKAILDFLYLHSEYKTVQDMSELRFDETFIENEMDRGRMDEYLRRFDCKALNQRVKTLYTAYGI